MDKKNNNIQGIAIERQDEHFARFSSVASSRTLTLQEVAEALVAYVHDKPEQRYRIFVGTDSAALAATRYITSVAILRIGNGGRYFWTKSAVMRAASLHDRIYEEAMRSITLLQELRSLLRENMGDDFCENNMGFVHLDIGTHGRTRDLIDGVTGMVKGYGFEPIIKPDAFCASSVADRHT